MRLEGWRVLNAPLCFACLAVGLLGFGAVAGLPALPTLLALATVVAVMVRSGLAFAENLRLLNAHREARTDELTGLLNRRGFGARVDERLGAVDRRVELLLLDLDRFKELNDTLGHQTGDDLLRELGERLRIALPADAVVGRLGGDEFVALVPGDSHAGVPAGQLVLDALEAPFALDDVLAHVSGSVGVAVAPDHGTTRVALLRHADIAMY
nr:GGDEF domain-containing protein [Solirubrobacterales bacterium]